MTVALQRLDIPAHVNILGTLTGTEVVPSAGTVTNTSFSAIAADALTAAKQEHLHVKTYAQNTTTNATVERRVLHVVIGATGTILDFSVGTTTIATVDATCVVDLLKNGSSILSSAITLDSGNTNRVLESASGFSSVAVVAGDWLELKVTSATAAAGAIPIGLVAQLRLKEVY